jgi:hypothetical protein
MKLHLKTSGDVKQFIIKRNNEANGREALVDIDLGVKKENADNWGPDFLALAFSTMRVMEPAEDDEDSGNTIGYLVDTIKPGKRLVVENHEIEIDGYKFKTQPELKNIKTIDGVEAVVVCMRIPIAIDNKELLDLLTSKVGSIVKIEFSPLQGSLGFNVKKVKKSEIMQPAMQ